MSRAAATGAEHRRCDRCSAAVLRQTAGLPYTVIADALRLTAAKAAALTTPNRLAWCLRETAAGVRLVEVLPSVHGSGCPTPHVIEHVCQPEAPRGRRPEGGSR
ncbi:hypothetical protein [Streptomyces sp. NPDC019937]|uniref:hypothetical protein n=1 Tax=Streptomyces sp. NPDC019937 TaxID=3154787 RepID=UPI0033D1EB24